MIEILGWIFLVLIIIGFIWVALVLIIEWTDNGYDLQTYLRTIFNRSRAYLLLAIVCGGWIYIWAEFYADYYNKKYLSD